VERSANGGPFIVVRTLGAGGTSFVDTGVTAGNYYRYRIRAENDGGASSYADTGPSDPVVDLPCTPGEARPASIVSIEYSAPSPGKLKVKGDEFLYVVGDTVTAIATVDECTTFERVTIRGASTTGGRCDPIEGCVAPVEEYVVSDRENNDGTRTIEIELSRRAYRNGAALRDIGLAFTSGTSSVSANLHWIGVADIDVDEHITTISEDEVLNRFIAAFYQIYRDINSFPLDDTPVVSEEGAEPPPPDTVEDFEWDELRVDILPDDEGIRLKLKTGTSFGALAGTGLEDCAPNVTVEGILQLEPQSDDTSLFVGARWRDGDPKVDYHYFDSPITCPPIIPVLAKSLFWWGFYILEKTSEDNAARTVTDNLRIDIPQAPAVCRNSEFCFQFIDIRTRDNALEVALQPSLFREPDNVVVEIGYNEVAAVEDFTDQRNLVDLRAPLLLPGGAIVGVSASGIQRVCRGGDLQNDCGPNDGPLGSGEMEIGAAGLFNYAWDTDSTTGWMDPFSPFYDPYFSPVPDPWVVFEGGATAYSAFRHGGWNLQRGLSRSVCESSDEWRFCAPLDGVEIGRFIARFHDGENGQLWYFDHLFGSCALRPVEGREEPIYLELGRNDAKLNEPFRPYAQGEGKTRVVVSFATLTNDTTPTCPVTRQ